MYDLQAAPLEVLGLGHRFGDVPAVHDVSLSVAPGELVALLGPSGCGKSTLLRSIAGLTVPTRGVIRVAGVEVCRDGRDLVPAERRRVGLVFQNYALFDHLTVHDNVAFGIRPFEADRVRELLEVTDLVGLEERRPSELSGGQQQRVALARALAPRPDLLLLDEPFANVDAALRERLADELRRVLERQGTSALLVTHDRQDAMHAADRVAVMVRESQGGRLAQCDRVDVVYRRPSSAEVASLTGRWSSLSGNARGTVADTAMGPLPLAEECFGPVEVVLRPEHVRFVPDPAGTACVQSASFVGRCEHALVRIGDDEVRAECDFRPEPGTTGRLDVTAPAWAVAPRAGADLQRSA